MVPLPFSLLPSSLLLLPPSFLPVKRCVQPLSCSSLPANLHHQAEKRRRRRRRRKKKMSVWLLWNSLSASRRWSLFSRSFIFIISSSSSSFFRLVSHHPIPPVLLFSPSPSFRFDFDFVSVSPTPTATLLLHPRPPLFPPSLGESGSESRDGARLRQCFMFTKETVGIPVCAAQEPLCCISLLFHTRPPTSPIQTSNSAAPSSSSWREAVSTAALRNPRSPISRRLDLLREAEIDLLAATRL